MTNTSIAPIAGNAYADDEAPQNSQIQIKAARKSNRTKSGGYTQAEVAAVLGISKGRVHQIEASALKKLRRRLAPLFAEVEL